MEENNHILPESEPLNQDLVEQIAFKVLSRERSSVTSDENTKQTISALLQIIVDSVKEEASLRVR